MDPEDDQHKGRPTSEGPSAGEAQKPAGGVGEGRASHYHRVSAYFEGRGAILLNLMQKMFLVRIEHLKQGVQMTRFDLHVSDWMARRT